MPNGVNFPNHNLAWCSYYFLHRPLLGVGFGKSVDERRGRARLDLSWPSSLGTIQGWRAGGLSYGWSCCRECWSRSGPRLRLVLEQSKGDLIARAMAIECFFKLAAMAIWASSSSIMTAQVSSCSWSNNGGARGPVGGDSYSPLTGWHGVPNSFSCFYSQFICHHVMNTSRPWQLEFFEIMVMVTW